MERLKVVMDSSQEDQNEDHKNIVKGEFTTATYGKSTKRIIQGMTTNESYIIVSLRSGRETARKQNDR